MGRFCLSAESYTQINVDLAERKGSLKDRSYFI